MICHPMQERYGTAIIHEDVEESGGDSGTVAGNAYGTVVVAGEAAAAGGYLDAVRMAGEQYGSREVSPVAVSSGGAAAAAAGGSPQSGYWAAVASASEAGAVVLSRIPGVNCMPIRLFSGGISWEC